MAHHDPESLDGASEGLKELHAKPPQEQADFWSSCVTSKPIELEEIGGLPADGIANDVLLRHFDCSLHFLNKMFRCTLRHQKGAEKECLTKWGLYHALSHHCTLFDVLPENELEAMLNDKSNECFERICTVVGLPCSWKSFAATVKHIRMALLLRFFLLSAEEHHTGGTFLHHMDYDSSSIHTPFVTATVPQSKDIVSRGKTYTVPLVETQVPLSHYGEYLFTSEAKAPGNVHWTHMTTPSVDMVVAVGAGRRLPSPAVALLNRLGDRQAQISLDCVGYSNEDKDKAMHGWYWSSMALPACYLDRTSRESLMRYRIWSAKSRGGSQMPPRIRVASVRMTLGFVWGSKTLISTSSEPYYIGKWNTDTEEQRQKSFFANVLDFLTCAWCCWRKPHGYEKLPQEEPDDCEVGNASEMSPELKEALESNEACHMGEKATDTHECFITFERMFQQSLLALSSRASPLRNGNNFQLLTRIILNRTIEYLDIVEVYQAAIARLGYLLGDSKTQSKHELIGKIEQAQLELKALQRYVEPFGKFVIPELYKASLDVRDDYPSSYQHVKNTHNTFNAFMPACDSLIQKCTHLIDAYDRDADHKTNNILNILTLITFVFTPVLILTGVYGMNWDHFPEIGWNYGYLYFWIMACSLVVIFKMILVCLYREAGIQLNT